MERPTGAAGAYTYIDDRPMTVRDRLESFRDLEDGWTPEGGLAPDHAGMDWLAGEFENHYPDDLATPLTFPTGGGGIALEWWDGNETRADLEVDLKRRTATWCAFHPNSCDIDVYHEDLVVDSPHFWPWLAEQVRALDAGKP